MSIKTLYLPLVVACLLMAGCERGGDTPSTVPETPQSVLAFRDGTTLSLGSDGCIRKEIAFESTLGWTATASVPWITLSKEYGDGSDGVQTIAVSIPRLFALVPRSGEVSVTSPDGTITLAISQQAPVFPTISAFFQAVRDEGYVHQYICAHRGNTYEGIYKTKDCPENSVAAVRRCIDLGLEMVEIDVRQTKDGVLVCCHDDAISNTTTGSGVIADMTYEEICRYDMRIRATGIRCPGQKMSTLSQILRVAKGRIWINLDAIKVNSDAFFKAMVDTLKQEGMLDQVTYYVGSSKAYADKLTALSDGKLSIDLYVGSAADGTTKLAGNPSGHVLQIYKGTWEGVATPTVPDDIRKAGFCSLANMLESDSQLLQGKTTPLVDFTRAKIDFMQTDYGDCPTMQNYLVSNNLR